MQKKDLIYYYLIEGFPACKIANFKDIKCSKVYVHKVIRNLINEGYIFEVKGKSVEGRKLTAKPKLYSRTSRRYPAKLTCKLTKLTKGVRSQPRIHLITLKFPIIKVCRNIPVSNKDLLVEVNRFRVKETEFVDVKKVFDVGRVCFRLVNDKTLIVFIPGVFSDPLNFRTMKNELYGKVRNYANWFQKAYGCLLGDPEEFKEPEIGISEEDPFLCNLVENYGFVKLVDSEGRLINWWDRSRSYTEFETSEEGIAEIKMFTPAIISNVQDRLFNLQNAVEAHDMIITGINENVREIKEGLGAAIRAIDRLAGLIEAKAKDLDERGKAAYA